MGISPTLNIPQARFLAMQHKFKAYVAGFGSGKTWVGCGGICKGMWEQASIDVSDITDAILEDMKGSDTFKDLIENAVDSNEKIAGMADDIKQANDELEQQAQKIAQNAQDIGKVQTNVTNLSSKVGDVSSSLNELEQTVATADTCLRSDIAEDGFSWCGCGTANTEAEGIKIFRLDVGVYMLTGSEGLASEGWQLLPPMDPGGMGELGVVEAEQTESGGLTIRLFKRKYMLSDNGEIVKTKGEPMDVPVNSWIDVRLDMPADSLVMQRMNQGLQP
ncbi:TPA: hypothetical protein N5N96_002382 [Enterobacter hormaechei subsp. steigerwaltii]|nr:hypothetical protein [Enterobacter hormaechei subsp. steigerwaltii]